MRRYNSTTVLALAVFMLSVSVASAQVITSTIYGTVTDPSGASIPGATVKVISESSGTTATVVANDTGEFTVGSLQPGRYAVQIEAQGFKAQKQTGLQVAAGDRLRVTYALEIGSVSSTVEVSAAAPILNSVTAEQRSNIVTQQVSELPTSRRNWTGLLELNSGVNTVGGSVSLNGLPSASLKFTVDGTEATASSEQPSISLYQSFNNVQGVSMEAVDEVNVAKGIASAEISNSMSGNVNIITKRGTNQFHGSLFELNQTAALNARVQTLKTKPGLTYNQYGGSFGGPIFKNKLFAFGAYEGYQLRGFSAFNGAVPTKEFADKATAAVPAYKPYFALFPLPNQAYTAGSITGIYIGADTQKGHDNHMIVRSDFNLTDRTIVTGRYTRGRPNRRDPRIDYKNYRDFIGKQEVGTLGVIHTAGSWTSETRFGTNYNYVNRLDNIYALGVAGISGNLGFSSGGETLELDGTTWSVDQIFGMTKGRHSLRFGGQWTMLHVSRQNIEAPDIKYANEADFLANIPNSVQVTFGVKYFVIRQSNYGFFIQDDFKVNRRLVLNLGMRYDYYTVPKEKDKRLFNRTGPFGYGAYRDGDSVFNAKPANFSPRLGFAYTMDGAGKTVLRGGAGIFYNPKTPYGAPIDLVQNALDEPFRSVFSRNDVLKYGDPLRYLVVNDKVLPIVKGPQASISGIATDPDWNNPHSYQWQLSIQRELTKDLVIETGYVGTAGKSLVMTIEQNQPGRLNGIRPAPGYLTFRYRTDQEASSYHAMQTSLRKRFSAGLMTNVNYTWSKLLSYTGDADLLLPGYVADSNNIRGNHGPANTDRPHRFIVDTLYELPFDKMVGASSKAAKMLLGGWQLSGIFNAQSGDPFNVTFPLYTEQRPDATGQAQILDNWQSSLKYLNPAAYSQIPLSSVNYPVRPGNLSRNSVYGPGWWRMDMSFAKNTNITEKVKFQLRFDMFNAFNHTNLSGIRNDIRRADFGYLTGTRGARTIQVFGRLTF
jgi:hypothetical protein